MMMRIQLDDGWSVLQDVHDDGETLGLFKDLDLTQMGHQLSEWEPIDRLVHLQLLFSEHPYWGHELRSFNMAPWWYRKIIDIPVEEVGKTCVITFSNIDYFAKVWFNGHQVADHEGYSAPFSCDVTEYLHAGQNLLVVKVWSPWDQDVRNNDVNMRTQQVERRLVKGTYEHSDGFIQRDVNPVGIYGDVVLSTYAHAYFSKPVRISAMLDEQENGTARLRGETSGESTVLHVSVTDPQTGEIVASKEWGVSGEFDVSIEVASPRQWWTWDTGEPALYELAISLQDDVFIRRSIGFRKVELIRDEATTEFMLNGKPFYMRGTSYFPDIYMSAMSEMRYERDLRAIKSAGFNSIRVHVHVENDVFYDMCDRMGLAVVQDSEYNWTQPKSKEWADIFIQIYLETVLLLDRHASVLAWICLNEPGVADTVRGTRGYAMSVSPGPRIYEAVCSADSTRPVIKGSFCEDDLTSGDSHNYRGSLELAGEPYTVIDGTTEKLNTEFGFDAPGVFDNLRGQGKLFKRLRELARRVPDLQYYQLRLTKYYIEHYRCQKGTPNWGYIQFMFIDLCPQSFYGVLDYWGVPKPVHAEVAAINQPVGVFLDQTKQFIQGIVAVNDRPQVLENAHVSWRINKRDGETLFSGERMLDIDCEKAVIVEHLRVENTGDVLDATLLIRDESGNLVASNVYSDIFGHPDHPTGHPDRISHEFGMRVFDI